MIVGYHNGNAVKLADVADVEDSVENLRAGGFANGKPSVLVIMFKQPQANIIDTVDRIRQALPALKASIPSGIDFTVTMDRTTTIRASVRDVERTLLISVGLVILVVFLFLRNAQATLIPSVAVPVSLIGTFGVMYLCRLQPRQSLAHGADDFDGVCRGRRDRGGGEHHPLFGTGA